MRSIGRKTVLAVAVAAAAATMTACSDPTTTVHTALDLLDEGVMEIQRTGDPWRAFEFVDEKLQGMVCGQPKCPEVQAAIEHAVAIGTPLLQEALRHADPRAILYVLQGKNGHFLDLRRLEFPRILSYAEKADGSAKEDGEIVMRTAQMLGDNGGVAADVGMAIKLMHKAWKLGNGDAAGGLAGLYRVANDIDNAYFWQLRCKDGCHLNGQLIEPSELKPGRAQLIEGMALRPDLLNVAKAAAEHKNRKEGNEHGTPKY
jgi:hypothetical protein